MAPVIRKPPIGERYYGLFAVLSPMTLYTPATLATYAIENMLVVMETDIKHMRGRLRTTFSRLSQSCTFTESLGDGSIIIPGQAPMVAYFGWRWQKAAGCTAIHISLQETQAWVEKAQARWDQEASARAEAAEATKLTQATTDSATSSQ